MVDLKREFELLEKQEPLCEELEAYLVESPIGGKMLTHPLVYQILYDPVMNSFMNKCLVKKREALERALKEKNWSSYIYLHERPFRLLAFLDIMGRLLSKEYWTLLRSIWVDSENIWQNKQLWQRLLSSKKRHREFFMTSDEQEFFKSLPKAFSIYRGYKSGLNFSGLSYTLSKEKAEWFAKRFPSNPGKVRKKKIKKSDVFAYVSRGDEKEIILLKG